MLMLERKKRIFARIFQGKQRPHHVYRLDRRPPEEIRGAGGFHPRSTNGTITLIEHVTRTYQSGANIGNPTADFSQWVSTGAYRMFQPMDGVFAQGIFNFWLYQINADLAMATGNFTDVNDHFDRAGQPRPYASQREWIKFGGIEATAITAYMSGTAFFNQFIGVSAPDEAALTGWTTFVP